jgi:hypothetical protein
LGNNKGFVVQTAEVSIDSLHQFSGRQQPGRFDHGPFPIAPMRFQGIGPGAFDGQETRLKPQTLAVPCDALVVLAEPMPHGVAAVPRSIIPYQQQRRLASGAQLGTDPGQKLHRQGTHGAAAHKAQPHVFLADPLGSPLLHQQAITRQGFRLRISRGDNWLNTAQGLLGGCLSVQRWLGHATPPRLILKAQRPLPMTGGQADQTVAGFFFGYTPDRDW